MTAMASAIALTGNDQAVYGGPAIYRGFAVRETSGVGTIVIQIFDNATTNSGTLLETIKLASNESAGDLYVDGIRAAAGIYVKLTKTAGGTVEGSVRIG